MSDDRDFKDMCFIGEPNAIKANIDTALANVGLRRKERAAMLDGLDLGELRSFSISEADAHDAIDRLAVCDVCGCIGDASRTKRGEVNQTDGTVPLICDKHWPED